MMRRGVSSLLEQSSCPSMYFRASQSLHEPPAMQANTDYINIVNPKINFIKRTRLGSRLTFSLQPVFIKMIWRVCLYLVMECNPGMDGCLWEWRL